MTKQAKEGLTGFGIALVFMLLVALCFKTFAGTSVVAFDGRERCAWVRMAEDGFEKRVCPLVLPARYEKVYVHYDDRVGS